MDNIDYDEESDMAKSQLYETIQNAMELMEMIESGENLDGWVAAKITKAADYINAVHSYMLYEKQYKERNNISDEYMESIKKTLEDRILNSLNEAKPSAGLSKKQKSAVVKKAKSGGDIGHKGKGFKDVVSKAKKSGARDPEAVAAAAMWKNIKR